MPGSNPYSQAAASGVATRVAPAAVPDAPDTSGSNINLLNFLSAFQVLSCPVCSLC